MVSSSFWLVGWNIGFFPADFAQLFRCLETLRGAKYARVMSHMVPIFGRALPIPVYFLEIPGGVRPGPRLYVMGPLISRS